MEATALALQDVHGQPPVLLLWRLWTLEAGGGIDEPTVTRSVDVTRAWQAEILDPLRGVRRRLKARAGPSAVVGAPGLREQVLAAELSAEKALLSALQGLAGDRTGPPAEPLSALAALADLWRPPAPVAELRRLVELMRPEGAADANGGFS